MEPYRRRQFLVKTIQDTTDFDFYQNSGFPNKHTVSKDKKHGLRMGVLRPATAVGFMGLRQRKEMKGV